MGHPSLLSGKTALVTGGTAGIGFYTASALASLGAEVFITGRNAGRGQEAERVLRLTSGSLDVHFIRADASSVGGNQELANLVLGKTDRLHILVNNVGGLYNDRWETDDCYEATLAMNLVGPFALTQALLPALLQSAPARIANVTSAGFTMWKGDLFADLQWREAYSGFHAYNRSKYLNLLWTLALARRLEGSGVVANAIHPGTAWTSMTKGNEVRILPAGLRLFWPIFRLIQRSGSAEKAARTPIFLASAPEAANLTGQYFESSTRPKQIPAEALDRENQEKTWELAEALVRNAPTAISVEAVESGIADH
jgi:NAD(P)-dependent dehydrogenase (short-subunit alcohol dehydrogenase family)